MPPRDPNGNSSPRRSVCHSHVRSFELFLTAVYRSKAGRSVGSPIAAVRSGRRRQISIEKRGHDGERIGVRVETVRLLVWREHGRAVDLHAEKSRTALEYSARFNR